jgi:glycosyltransferase involved in cell wall biosynthesis
MNNGLVSVIMPAYNAQKYIAESIESVIAQTYANWELIVIDDGSTDNTGNIIKQYKQQDVRIKSIYQENSGQGNAKNVGIEISRGEYIAFLDADDLWLKEKLEVSVNTIKVADVSLLFTNYAVFNSELDVSKLTTMQVGNTIYKGRESIITFLNYNQVPNLTVLAKREAVISAGKFTDMKVAEDYEMWLRMYGLHRVALGIGRVQPALPDLDVDRLQQIGGRFIQTEPRQMTGDHLREIADVAGRLRGERVAEIHLRQRPFHVMAEPFEHFADTLQLCNEMRRRFVVAPLMRQRDAQSWRDRA